MPYKKEYHVIHCPMCGKDYSVLTPAFLRKQKDPVYGAYCSACRAKVQWQEMTPEQKAERKEKAAAGSKARWESMTEEEKQKQTSARLEGINQYWSSLTEEQRAEKTQEMSKAATDAKKRLTDADRKLIGEKISNGKKDAFAAMSEEEKAAYKKSRQEERRIYWASLSDEQRQQIVRMLCDGSRKFYAGMSEEEFERWKAQLAAARNEYWERLTPEEKDRVYQQIGETKRLEWQRMAPEERQRRLDLLRDASRTYWDNPESRLLRSKQASSMWKDLSDEEKEARLEPLHAARENYLRNMSEEQLETRRRINGEISKRHWETMTEEELEAFREVARRNGIARWASLSPVEKEELLRPMMDGFRRYWDTMSDQDRERYADTMRDRVNAYWSRPDSRREQSEMTRLRWENKSEEERAAFVHKLLSGPTHGGNKLHNRFENMFLSSHLSRRFYCVGEILMRHDDTMHVWDYGIYDQNGELVMLVDLDGAYFHADLCDYDGIHSKEEYDERRAQSISPEVPVKTYIIQELKFATSFEEMAKILMVDYDDYVAQMFQEFRKLSFPDISYNSNALYHSYRKLVTMKCNDPYHESLSMSSRIGDRLIYHFHPSIYRAHRERHVSPYEAWKDDELLMKCIRNRIIYQTTLNPNKILQGFNVSKIAPKVSVFSAARAKMIISRYLSDFSTIFDPFSGFSGRMLGAVSLNKQYIGQDVSPIHVAESNALLRFLHEQRLLKDPASATYVREMDVLNSSGSYPCLFTCPPYGLKEQWLGVTPSTRSCDEWITICLENFHCERYVFVVDHTEQYRDFIVDTIMNKSHFLGGTEYLVVITK